MSEFRPILCYNIVYKCISKNNSKRKISDNVLLAQDLLRNYHKGVGKPRAAAKVDLIKAYDTVSWEFLNDMLMTLNFPTIFIKWINACISTPRYSINFNGVHRLLCRGRGLRQGDPMSPYLFIIAMDFLSQLMSHNIANDPNFKYHLKCGKLKISHLCFADDLLVMFDCNVHAASVVNDTISQFYNCTWLLVNKSKSCIFLAGIEQGVGEAICQSLQFSRDLSMR